MVPSIRITNKLKSGKLLNYNAGLTDPAFLCATRPFRATVFVY